MSLRASHLTVIALLAALIAGVLALEVLVAPPTPGEPAADAPGQQRGGSWVCPTGDTRPGTSLQVTAVAPGEVGQPPGQLELGTVEDGRLDVAEPDWVFPGTAARTGLEGEQAAVVARWREEPVALHRRWVLEGEEDLPPGVVAGPCMTRASDRWLIPGLATAGGHEARLRVANPYETDATVAIRFVTPEGPVEPTVLQNFTVEGHSTSEIEVNEHLPERDDVAVEVEVLAGRAMVEGYQLVRQAIGDVNGASLLAAATAPSSSWTIPWVEDGSARASWLWLLNPGERVVPVELSLHTADGGSIPEGLGEVTVEPGQLRRVDLRGTLPEGVRSAAVTARSEGEPIVASGVVRREPGDVTRTGTAVQLGVLPDERWVLAGGDVAGGGAQLRLVNPGSDAATVAVSLWDGTATRRPDELQQIEVPPGALVTRSIADALEGTAPWAAFVEASGGPVVAAHVGHHGEEALNLVAEPGIPSAAWSPSGPVLPGWREAGLTQRLGTAGARPSGDGPGDDR